MSPRVSVSQLRYASESFELLKRSLAGEVVWQKVDGFRTGDVPGSMFHDRVAAPLMTALRCGAAPDCARRLVDARGEAAPMARALRAALHANHLEPLLVSDGPDLVFAQVAALAAATDALAVQLAEALARLPRARTPADVAAWVLPGEQLHRAEFALPGGALEISGRFDAALRDARADRVLVLEFKTHAGAHPEKDLLQLALYAWLLRTSIGRPVDGALFFLGERGGTQRHDSDELAEIVESKGTREFLEGVRRVVAEREPPPPPAPAADDLVGRLVAALARLKCQVEPMEPLIGPRVIRCRVKPRVPHTTVTKLQKQAKDLQVLLELETEPAILGGPFVSIDLPRPFPPLLTLGEVLERGRANRPSSPVAFPLGVAIDGKVHWADMSDASSTSILVGGTAGSGKSEFLKSIVVAMALAAGPPDVRFTLVDPKLVTFTALKDLPHLDCPVITDGGALIESLERLVQEMERRYQLLSDAGHDNITPYNAAGKRLPHHVLLIDEYADLMAAKGTRETLEYAIGRLGAKGRAAGIHLVVATQHPSVKVISPTIKANLQLKIALKVGSGTNSKVVLDETGAEKLLGRGDMLVGGAIETIRLQSPLAVKDDLTRACAAWR